MPSDRTLVKVCGLRDAATARAALEAGADYLGFVLAPSRRQVSPDELRAIIRALPADAPTVGVFVDASASTVDEVVGYCGLAGVQLSGDEPAEVVRAIRGPVLKAFRLRGPEVEGEMAAYAGLARAFVLDAYRAGSYGGTGETCDWALAARLAARYPTFLAGGLTPENVGEAIAAVRPRGVDVSSGVEVGGRKSVGRIAAFVEAVRRADAVRTADTRRKRTCER